MPVLRVSSWSIVASVCIACLQSPLAFAQQKSVAGEGEVFAGTNVRHETATVAGITPFDNSVILRGQNGEIKRVEVDQTVGDVTRLQLGDEVNITYTRALLLHADPVDSKGIRERVDTDTVTPASGGVATATHRVQAVVTIVNIDNENHTLTLRGPTRTVTLAASGSLPLGKLKVGDSIRADYLETTVVRITRNGEPLKQR